MFTRVVPSILLLLSVLVSPARGIEAEDATYRVIKDTSCSGTSRLFLRACTPSDDNLTFVVVSLPSYGQLFDERNDPITSVPFALATNQVKYVPNYGRLAGSQDQFTWQAEGDNLTSNVATATVQVVDWFAPIGIPTPPFGINETHWMYDGQLYDYDGDGIPEAPYNDAGNGPYTHYIDNTDPNASEYNNPFGSPERPRKYPPSILPAGSVVEIHGGCDPTSMLYLTFRGAGTSDKPVFIRGVGPAAKAAIHKPVLVYGSYMILENLNVDHWSEVGEVGIAVDASGISNDHICVRHCEVHGNPSYWTSALAVCSLQEPPPPDTNTDIVVYDTRCYENGPWYDPEAENDPDFHGISLGSHSSRIWIVDNELYHDSGNGLQINGDFTTNHLYIGRNIAWENRQTGFGNKRSCDTIFSQNIAFNHQPCASDPEGGGICFQHGPERIWFLFNRLYGNTSGIVGPSGLDEFDGTNIYMIGNVIYDCEGAGISFWGSPETEFHVLNNTICRVGDGISCQAVKAVHVENNIISDIAVNWHIYTMFNTQFSSTLTYDLFYQNGQPLSFYWNGGYAGNSVVQFQSYTGQGQGCLEGNPAFQSAMAWDFRLQASSPARDAGVAHEVYQTFLSLYGLDISKDFDGMPRPKGGAWDMGAMETPVVQGSVLLQDFWGDNTTVPVTLELRSPGQTAALETHTMSLSADGHYSCPVIHRGVYDVAVKAFHWLRQKQANVDTTSDTAVNFSLINGDINNSNDITIEDYSTFTTQYDTAGPEADLNGSGWVTIEDYSILTTNYGLTGDE
jgi:hypothetical protein